MFQSRPRVPKSIHENTSYLGFSIHISQSRPRVSKSILRYHSQSRVFKSVHTSQSLPHVSKSIYMSFSSACIYVYSY